MTTRERKLGVCVVGLGMGYAHAESYSKFRDVDLYLCDIDQAKVEHAKAKLVVKGVFKTVDEALQSSKIEAIDAALPHDMHRDIAVRAAEAGKHFMSEKPLARNLIEADEMIGAAKKAGIKLMVAEGVRFQSSVIKARQFIDEGVLGKVFLVRVYQLESACLSGWRLDKEKTGGGNLIDSGIHAVHILRFLAAADVGLVFSQMTRFVLTKIGGEDTSVTVVRFKNEAVGNLITGWSVDAPMPETRFVVYGTDGILWQEWSGQRRLYLKSSKQTAATNEPIMIDVPKINEFDAECRHFIECILENKEPITGPKEARADVELVVAAYRSAETGMAVKLPLES